MNPRQRNAAVIALAVVGVVGYFVLYVKLMSHTMAGISRTVTVDHLPTAACAVTALRETPCVTSVQQHSVAPDVSWSFREGRVDHPGYDVVVYECGDSGGRISLMPRDSSHPARIDFGSTLYTLGDPHSAYPPARLDRIRETLNAVYSHLAERCGPLPDPAAVVETTH